LLQIIFHFFFATAAPAAFAWQTNFVWLANVVGGNVEIHLQGGKKKKKVILEMLKIAQQ